MVDNGAISLGGGGGAGGIDQLTGDVTAGPGTGSQVASLADVGTAETVGDAGHYPVITTDAKGRVTAVTAQAVPADVPLSTVTTAGDLIVAIGAGAVTRLPIGANGDVLTVAAGALGYAAPSGGGLDLLQFFQTTLPANVTWAAVAYGGGSFVAVSYGGTSAAYSTNGGVTWTAATVPNASGYAAIAFGNGTFVAVSNSSNAVAYSTNGGATWTASTAPATGGYTAIAYGGGTFVATAFGVNAVAHSTNGGVTWTAATVPNASGYAAIAFGGTTFVAVSNNSTAAAYSTNGGVTWTATTMPNASGYNAIAFGNGTFVAMTVGAANHPAASYSTNGGVTWTESPSILPYHSYVSVAYGNGTFVATAQGTGSVISSTDGGVTWTLGTVPLSGGTTGTTFGGGVFVVVPISTSATAARTDIVTIAGPNQPTWTNPTVTSGSAFQPSATSNCVVYFQINGAGSYTLTMGPSTAGTDVTVASAVALAASTDQLVELTVPMGWNVVLTLTTATLASVVAVTI